MILQALLICCPSRDQTKHFPSPDPTPTTSGGPTRSACRAYVRFGSKAVIRETKANWQQRNCAFKPLIALAFSAANSGFSGKHTIGGSDFAHFAGYRAHY